MRRYEDGASKYPGKTSFSLDLTSISPTIIVKFSRSMYYGSTLYHTQIGFIIPISSIVNIRTSFDYCEI